MDRLACFRAGDGGFTIVWSNKDLRTLGIVHRADGNTELLYDWWINRNSGSRAPGA